MIYKHTKSGVLYREVLEYWDVARQTNFILYVSLENGAFFGREISAFEKNFEFVEVAQEKIKPRKHPFIGDEK